MAQDDQQWLWVTWIRAYVLGQLERRQARDEARAAIDDALLRGRFGDAGSNKYTNSWPCPSLGPLASFDASTPTTTQTCA